MFTRRCTGAANARFSVSADLQESGIEIFLEISSDFLGYLSALAVAWPVYRIIRARGLLYEQKEAIRRANPTPEEAVQLLALLDAADRGTSGHDKTDERYVIGGLALLAASFALRAAFHIAKHLS